METDFYKEMLKKIEHYKKALKNIGFAAYELSQLKKTPENEKELLEAFDVIINSSIELNYILEEAPNSCVVCNADAICIRVNKAFEKMVKIPLKDIVGADMGEMHAKEIFRPSVCWLTLNAKAPVSVLQEINDVMNMVVTGVPVFDENGKLFRAFTNAVKVDEIEAINEYIMKLHKNDCGEKKKTKIIARSASMRRVIELADIVKNTDSNILITGETGTGKNVLASYIHETSVRGAKKMVSINCGAIPEKLLESELFGYERGAFTGADKNGKKGLIEASDGGTLFLDEISELPILLQVKLLNFLQTKKLTRVGGIREVSIDTRVIAASNKPLEDEVKKGAFRSDLYYRINVIPINIPSLAERKEDLVEMAEYFLDLYGGKYRKKIEFTDKIKEFVINRKWEGNVRELENYIERLVITNDADWYINLEEKSRQRKNGKLKEKVSIMKNGCEKEEILTLYEKHKSSYKVAEELGISQSTAYRKIRRYMNDLNDLND